MFVDYNSVRCNHSSCAHHAVSAHTHSLNAHALVSLPIATTQPSLPQEEGGYSREDLLEVFQHFCWSLDGERGMLCQSTWSMNHGEAGSDALNVIKSEEEGLIVGTAKVDIETGAELCNNYRDMVMPQFYLDFCAEHGFKDVKAAVVEAIDG